MLRVDSSLDSPAADRDDNAGICSPVMSSPLDSISKLNRTVNNVDSSQHEHTGLTEAAREGRRSILSTANSFADLPT